MGVLPDDRVLDGMPCRDYRVTEGLLQQRDLSPSPAVHLLRADLVLLLRSHLLGVGNNCRAKGYLGQEHRPPTRLAHWPFQSPVTSSALARFSCEKNL
jgi:hypothetical protein